MICQSWSPRQLILPLTNAKAEIRVWHCFKLWHEIPDYLLYFFLKYDKQICLPVLHVSELQRRQLQTCRICICFVLCWLIQVGNVQQYKKKESNVITFMKRTLTSNRRVLKISMLTMNEIWTWLESNLWQKCTLKFKKKKKKLKELYISEFLSRFSKCLLAMLILRWHLKTSSSVLWFTYEKCIAHNREVILKTIKLKLHVSLILSVLKLSTLPALWRPSCPAALIQHCITIINLEWNTSREA